MITPDEQISPPSLACSILGTRGFSRGANFWCWPKAEATSGEAERKNARVTYKDLTETGNRARKVSGTHGTFAQQHSSTLCVHIHFCKTPQLYNFKTRHGGETLFGWREHA